MAQAGNTPTLDMDFDDAFKSLSGLMDDLDKDDVMDAAAEEEDETPPIEAAEEEDTPPVEEAAAEEGDEPPADNTDDEPPAEGAEAATADDEPPADEPPADAAPEDKDQQLLDRLTESIREAVKPEPKEEPPAAETPPAEEQPLYSDEEQAVLSAYEEEFPDVAKAEALKRRGEYQQFANYMFETIAQELRPIVEAVQVLSERTHLNDLHSAVEDYDSIRDDVVAWVDEQPAYLQAAYKHVIDQGTADEVSDLISRYKQEKGLTAQQLTPEPEPKETDLPATTKQAASSLAPVGSKRTSVPREEDPNDFEGAFKRFAEG